MKARATAIHVRWNPSLRVSSLLLLTFKTTALNSTIFNKVTWVLKNTHGGLKTPHWDWYPRDWGPNHCEVLRRSWPKVLQCSGTPIILHLWWCLPSSHRVEHEKKTKPLRKTYLKPLSQRTLSSTRGVFNPLLNPRLQLLRPLKKTHLHKINPHPVLTQIEGTTSAKACKVSKLKGHYFGLIW